MDEVQMMDSARTSETSVDNYFTWQYMPEDNFELHTRRREHLKSHLFVPVFVKPKKILNYSSTDLI
jgi:hypothetical protein